MHSMLVPACTSGHLAFITAGYVPLKMTHAQRNKIGSSSGRNLLIKDWMSVKLVLLDGMHWGPLVLA